jgi:hypothetical protein
MMLVLIFRWLCNITAPEVFGLKTITFWQAFRLLILASILFGGTRVIDVAPDTLNGDTTEEQHESS